MSRKAEANLKTAYVFFFLVGGLILISLFFRAIFLLKESKFDGSSHFTIQNNISEKKIQAVSFSPKNSTIGILNLEETDPVSLDIPIDAKISSDQSFTGKNITSELLRMALNLKNQKDVSIIDFLRLLFFSSTVKDNSISEKTVSGNDDKSTIDSVTSTFFIDPQVSDEKLNIEIVNATEIYGLGNKVANLISNMGGNVILVSTGDLRKTSQIEYVKNSYTVEKLSSILRFKKVSTQKLSLPDVIITIGGDYVR